MTTSDGTRINKWLSEMGVCSRRQADRLINQQQVQVNGQPATLGMLIAQNDEVKVGDELISQRPAPQYILYYKPVGVVCTHQLTVKDNLEQALNFPERVFAVGRLDKASEGLLLLTNQGEIVNKIMRAEHKQPKKYYVWVDKPVTAGFIEQMSQGVEILGQTTLACEVEYIGERQFAITLVQGLNRQIRRMCQTLGYKVERLQRIQIMHLTSDALPPGSYRQLTDIEIAQLYTAIDY